MKITQRSLLMGALLVLFVTLPIPGLLGIAAAAQDEAAPAAAAAPKYDEMPVLDTLDIRGKPRAEVSQINSRLNELRTEIKKILNGEVPLSGSEARFDGFFNRYVFPRWTWISKIENSEQPVNNLPPVNNFNFLAKERYEFAIRIFKEAKAPDVHDHLLKITLAKMKEIANGNYHPVARYNAMVVIGELNQKEIVLSGGPPSNSEPYFPMVPVFLETLEDDKQLDIVKIAALMGLARYVEFDSGLPQAKRMKEPLPARIDSTCLAIINTKFDPDAKQLPPGRSVDGHVWMQRRALEILSDLGTLGTNVNTVITIDGIVGDTKAPLLLRCSAAEALGQLNLPPATKLNAVATTKKLGELAVYACNREIKRLDEERKFYDQKLEWQRGSALREIGPGGAPKPITNGPAGPPTRTPAELKLLEAEDYKRIVSQRRIKSQLYCVAIGLEGVKGKGEGVVGLASEPAATAFAKEVAKQVTGLRDYIDDVTDLDVLVKELKARVASIDALTKAAPSEDGKKAPPAAAADELPGDAPPAAPKSTGTEPAAATKPAVGAPKTELPE